MSTGKPSEILFRRSAQAFKLPLRLLPFVMKLPPAQQAVSILAKPVTRRDTEGLLTGHTIEICIKDLAIKLTFLIKERGIKSISSMDQADVTIRGNLRDYLSLLVGREDPDTLFFQRRLVMEGDTELGLVLKNSLLAVMPRKGSLPFDIPGLIRLMLENYNELRPPAGNPATASHRSATSHQEFVANSAQLRDELNSNVSPFSQER